MQMRGFPWIALAAAASIALTGFAQEKKPSPAKAEVGEPAPPFELKGCDGKTYKLSAYKDKVVVLEWINYRCPISDGARPFMKDNEEKYAKKGVVWLAIDSTWNNKRDDVAAYNRKKGISFPVLLDADGVVGRRYGAKTTPNMFVINKGKLVYAGAHDNRGDRNYIGEALDATLAGKEVPLAETQPYGCSIKYKPDQK